jgi:hypothetical protein
MNDDLITRLKAVPEGSRELDAEIAEAVIWLPGRAKHLQEAGRGLYETAQGLCARFTTSLDAALTLVPEGWEASIVVEADGSGSARVWERLGDTSSSRTQIYEAAGPALALCIAALKARAAGGKSDA